MSQTLPTEAPDPTPGLLALSATDGVLVLALDAKAAFESLRQAVRDTFSASPDRFRGKDARDLEALLEDIYVYKSNYKLQNLALWVPLATIEFAMLDMLGRMAGKSMGELIGDIHQSRISVYQANNYRGKSAEESLEGIKEHVAKSQAKAVKFKLGGRMSKNAD